MKNLYSLILLAASLLLGSGSLNAQNVLFSEEFDGGIGGWTNDIVSPLDSSFWNWSDNKWNWSADGNVSNGAFCCGATQPNAILSPSVANGAMVFNADNYTTQDVNTNVPPGPPYVPYLCHLVSPTIDLSGATALMEIQFYQYFRFLNITTGAPGGFRISVSWSADDGLTWSDAVNVGEGFNANQASAADFFKKVPLPASLIGVTTAKIRFSFSSDFYYWVIDDVRIVERAPNDMQANSNWYAIAPNFQWPGSQVENFGFLCDISNVGANEQTGVNLNVTVVDDATSAVVYTADQAYGTIGIDSIAENVSFGAFTPDAAPATYTATYTVSADNTDDDPNNNSLDFQFSVTDTVFAKEGAPTTSVYPAAANWDAGEPRSWAWGNYYFLPNGDGWFANTATFSIAHPTGAPATGQTLQVVLYEWNDTNADGNADPGERTSVANNLYVMTGAETQTDLITVPLTNLFTGFSPALSDGVAYLLCLEYNAEDETQVRFGASALFDYGAMVLNSEQQGNPRYNYVLGINGNLEEEPYGSAGFNSPFAPTLRLNIGETPLFSSTKELLNSGEIVKISPNPANDFVAFDVKLNEASSLVRVQLLDLTGKLVGMQEFQNLKDINATFKTDGLANGTYFVRIDTDFGYATKKFVVQK